MTDLEKYQAVNKTQTLEELAQVIESFADQYGEIAGRSRFFDAKKMANFCRNYTLHAPNSLTREYGIRQQAMMLQFYTWFYLTKKYKTRENN